MLDRTTPPRGGSGVPPLADDRRVIIVVQTEKEAPLAVDPDTLTRPVGVPMTERQLQDAVVELAGYLGYLCFHPYDSRRSTPGWPDLTLVGHGRFLVVEVKRERGRVSAAQQRWLDELALAGVATYVWRPWHYHSGEIENVLRGTVKED